MTPAAARVEAAVDALAAAASGAPSAAIEIAAVEAPVAPPERLLGADPALPALVWAEPGGAACAGLGEVWRTEPRGAARFADAEREARRVLGDAASAPGAPAPALFGGFAFAPGGADAPRWNSFGDGQLVLPRWLYTVADGRATLALARTRALDPVRVAARARHLLRALTNPSPLPPAPPPRVVERVARESWAASVDAARAAIAAGAFEKVVLARRTRLAFAARPDVVALLARLRERHPEAQVFAFRRWGTVFLGASPELLVRKRGLAVEAEALAGTAAREEAAAADDPRRAALEASGKDLEEHRLVVDAIREALAPCCAELSVPARPGVRELRDLYHLHTPIRGRLREDVPLLRLAGALHPTPAMGGWPREAALAWLARHEAEPRGWYTGPVGRLGQDGDGTFVVAIRAALLGGGEALVYAGAGIVAASDAAVEYHETNAKERAMLAVLEAGPPADPPVGPPAGAAAERPAGAD